MNVNEACWLRQPAYTSPLHHYLTEPGSLTARLMATGYEFTVSVQIQEIDTCLPDEQSLLPAHPQHLAYVRRVVLSLNSTPVVYARSVIQVDCPVWRPILERGNRSLGLTLFSGLSELKRRPLHYADLTAEHPLHQAAMAYHPQDSYQARRCCFEMYGAPLIVTEVFLSTLERFTT